MKWPFWNERVCGWLYKTEHVCMHYESYVQKEKKLGSEVCYSRLVFM